VEIARKVTVEGTPLPALPESGNDRAVGLAAPVLQSVDFQGKDVQAGGATGAPYALTFLAHWCPHCQAEVPVLVSLRKQLRKAGVELTGVATGTTSAAPNFPPSEWLEDEDWPYGVLVDDASRSAGQAYGLTSYPFFVFVDAEGNVAGRGSGEIPKKNLKRIVKALAAGETLPIAGAGSSSSSG
jgi:thiol-disulfide isomerase/thioredoxin